MKTHLAATLLSMTIKLRSLPLVFLSVTLAASCAPDPSNPDQPVAEATSALTDAFWTPVIGADPVVAIFQDRAYMVWMAETTDGVNLVGQLFSTSTLRPINASRPLTHTNSPKAHPQVAASSVGFFFVYEDQAGTSDVNILGGTVGPMGTPVNQAFINTAGTFDTSPALTWVPGVGQWFVAYIRADSSQTFPPPLTHVLGTFVNTAGVPQQEFIIQDANPTNGDFFEDLTIAANNTNIITVAYRTLGSVFFQSLSTSNPLGRFTAIPGSSEGVSLAYNANLDKFAVVTSQNFQTIRSATFPAGCISNSCASSRTVVPIGSGTLGPPSVAPVASGFMTTYGVTVSGSNPVRIIAQQLDSFGNVNGAVSTTLFPSCPTSTPNPLFQDLPLMTNQGSAGNSTLALSVFGPRCDGAPNVYGARFSSPSTFSSFPVSDVDRSFYALTFDNGDSRRYLADPTGDWAQNQYKAECGPSDRVSGISATSFLTGTTLYPHSALCTEQPRGIALTRSTYSFANGGQRGDTSTGPWDAGFSMAECASTETVTGISRFPGAGLGTLLCGGLSQVAINVSNCTTLQYSISSDNRLNTSTGDWAQNFIKNECAANQQLKGVSMNPSTGEIHALLCCGVFT